MERRDFERTGDVLRIVIKEAALRGIESSAMLCSAKELTLSDAPEEKGIQVLDDSYQIGATLK